MFWLGDTYSCHCLHCLDIVWNGVHCFALHCRNAIAVKPLAVLRLKPEWQFSTWVGLKISISRVRLLKFHFCSSFDRTNNACRNVSFQKVDPSMHFCVLQLTVILHEEGASGSVVPGADQMGGGAKIDCDFFACQPLDGGTKIDLATFFYIFFIDLTPGHPPLSLPHWP